MCCKKRICGKKLININKSPMRLLPHSLPPAFRSYGVTGRSKRDTDRLLIKLLVENNPRARRYHVISVWRTRGWKVKSILASINGGPLMNRNSGKCRALKWSASQVFREIDSIAVEQRESSSRTHVRSGSDLHTPKAKTPTQNTVCIAEAHWGKFKPAVSGAAGGKNGTITDLIW